MSDNFPSLFELFEPCSVLGQKKTATVSIEFSKERALCKKRKPAPNKAPRTKTTQRKPLKRKNACGENTPKIKSPAALKAEKIVACGETDLFFRPAYGELGPAQYFFACDEKWCGTGKSWCGKPRHTFSTWYYGGA